MMIREPLKKPILTWDPDFTKLTPGEAKRLAEAEAEAGGFIDEADIDWEHLEQYQ